MMVLYGLRYLWMEDAEIGDCALAGSCRRVITRCAGVLWDRLKYCLEGDRG